MCRYVKSQGVKTSVMVINDVNLFEDNKRAVTGRLDESVCFMCIRLSISLSPNCTALATWRDSEYYGRQTGIRSNIVHFQDIPLSFLYMTSVISIHMMSCFLAVTL